MTNDNTRNQARKKRIPTEEKDLVAPEPTMLQAIMIVLIGFTAFTAVAMGGMRLAVHGYYMRPDVWYYDVMLVAGGLIISLLIFVFLPRKK